MMFYKLDIRALSMVDSMDGYSTVDSDESDMLDIEEYFQFRTNTEK